MKRFHTTFPLRRVEREPFKRSKLPFPVSDQLSLEVARIQATHHIREAAEIISNEMPNVDMIDRQLYASIVSGLYTLERQLAELSQS